MAESTVRERAQALSPERKGALLALVTAVLWGTIPVAGKFALVAVTPLMLSFVRFLLAGLLILGVAWAVRREHLRALGRPSLALLVVAALGLTGNYILYFEGLALTTATAAQLIIQLASVFLVMWGVLLFRESFTRGRAAGTAAAIVGVAIVSWNGFPLDVLLKSEYLWGNLLIMASALSWSFYAVAQKKLNAQRSSYENLMLILLACAALTALPTFFESGPGGATAAAGVDAASAAWGLVPILSVGYLVINTFLAYGAFAESLKHVDASVTAVITTFAPVVTVLTVLPMRAVAPALFSADALTGWTLFGGALIIGGIVLVVREGERAATETVGPE